MYLIPIIDGELDTTLEDASDTPSTGSHLPSSAAASEDQTAESSSSFDPSDPSSTKDDKLLEMSPFEKTKCFKCSFCTKRSQSLERIQRHLAGTAYGIKRHLLGMSQRHLSGMAYGIQHHLLGWLIIAI